MVEEYLLASGEGVEARNDVALGLDADILVALDALSGDAVEQTSVAYAQLHEARSVGFVDGGKITPYLQKTLFLLGEALASVYAAPKLEYLLL